MAASFPTEFAARLQSKVQQNSRQLDAGAAAPASAVSMTGLVVVEHDVADGQKSRGVHVDGKFVAVDLPEDVSSGDRIDVKVSTSTGETKLVFQGKTGQDVPVADARQRALDALLKTLDLNKESLAVLRTVLSSLPDAGGTRDGSHALPDALIKFLKNSGVADLLTPEKVKFELPVAGQRANQLAVRIITEVLKARDNRSEAGSSARVKEILRQAISELEILDAPEATENSSRPAALAKNAQQPQGDPDLRKQIKQLAPAFDRMLTLLRDRKTEAGLSDAASLEPFKRLVSSQLSQLKQVENKVALLLRDMGGPGTLGELVNALDSLRALTDGLADEPSRMLNTFARDLLKGIQNAVAQPENFSMLRKVLEQGLKQLYGDFGLVPFDQRILLSDPGSPPMIPHELRGMLRLLESQIVSLLADPHIEDALTDLLHNNSQQLLAKIKLVQGNFKDTLTKLLDFDHPDTLPLRQKIEQTLASFEQLVSPNSRTGSEPVSGRILRESLVDLNKLVRQFSGFEPASSPVHVAIPGQSDADLVQKTVRQIERQLLNLLAFGDSSAPDVESAMTFERLIDLIADSRNGAGAGQAGPISKNMLPVQSLKILLQQLALELPASGTPAEEDLSGAVYDLATHLEQIERQGSPTAASVREPIRQALTKFHQYLQLAEQRQSVAPELSSVDTESLKQAGSVLAAQETLQRMAPMMRAFGEPVLLLFPFVMGNFISRAQCTFYPGNESTERNADSQSGKGAETFTRLKIVVPLPAFGRVVADIAYRRGEILINLGYENQHVSDFVESKLVLLRKMLAGAGFEKIEIAARIVPVESLVGEHVEADCLRQAFQLGALA